MDIRKFDIFRWGHYLKNFKFYALNVRPIFWKREDTIQGRTLFKGGHYLRKYCIYLSTYVWICLVRYLLLSSMIYELFKLRLIWILSYLLTQMNIFPTKSTLSFMVLCFSSICFVSLVLILSEGNKKWIITDVKCLVKIRSTFCQFFEFKIKIRRKFIKADFSF